MRYSISLAAVLTCSWLLVGSAVAQTNQLTFRDGDQRMLQPAGFFAQISDSGRVLPASGSSRHISDSLTPVPESHRDAIEHATNFPVAPRVSSDESLGPMPITLGTSLTDYSSDAGATDSPAMGFHCDDGGYSDVCSINCADGCGLCCGPATHCTSIYAGYLYLRPRDADVAYAVPIDGPITNPPSNNPIQIGGYGVLDPDYDSGFFVGLSYALSSTSSLDARLTMFDSSSEGSISTAAPNVLRSLVAHPSSTSAASDFLSASANLDIAFDLVDVTHRNLWNCGSMTAVNTVVGTRYANLDQRFNGAFVNNGTETVNSDIDFDGVGMRVGLEAARYHCQNQLFLYANSSASFLAGRFRGSYLQGQSFDPVVVDTHWEAGRVVPILDLELGMGWASRTGKFRLSGGYQLSAWYNAVKTEEFIQAVQNNDLTELSDTMTFDGLNVSGELRF